MKQVRIFEADSMMDLERQINEFLKKLKADEFLGINYMAPNLKDQESRYSPIWSAMVSYIT